VSTDLIPAVLDYLVTQCQAAAVTGGTLTGVTVFDGPQPSASATGLEQVLWVGTNPLSPSEQVGDADQDFPHVGDQGRQIDENGSVICAAKYWSGNTAMQPVRDGCSAIVGAVQQMLQGTPGTGGPGDTTMGGLVFWSLIDGVTWWQQLVRDGGEAYCAFRIRYFGRLVAS
jgi:hypothetical protein